MFDYIDRYDWVILGGTDGARRGAQFAASRGARVALVEPRPQQVLPVERDRQMANLGRLMNGGVDVVLEEWVWERSPAPKGLAKLWSTKSPWLVRTENRWLWGDRYLYAEALSPQVPKNIQQFNVPICLPKDLESYLGREEGAQKNWAVFGGDVVAIAQSQKLAQRGDSVTLLLPHRYLIDGLYEPIDRHLQNLLEIDGVDIVWDAPVSAITAEQLPHQTDQILLGIQPTPLTPTAGPNFATQNRRAISNRHLQTSLPYLYLCGAALGGHTLPAIAQVEALTAISHGLSKKWRGRAFPPIDYGTIPWTITTNPPITQWGRISDAAQSVVKTHCDDGGSLWVMLQKSWRSQSKIIGAAGVGPQAQRA
ncbi:MAG: NAD-binding protein [Cyanobacteria bacterium P01_F01_bin.153]